LGYIFIMLQPLLFSYLFAFLTAPVEGVVEGGTNPRYDVSALVGDVDVLKVRTTGERAGTRGWQRKPLPQLPFVNKLSG
jgi:hypothetical protein